ncbi:MAG: glycoside hydrolase family 97 protein [Pirellulales bacterium]|nr:glycoside hydrolase family 97 protein [Pirellulales bacterium]
MWFRSFLLPVIVCAAAWTVPAAAREVMAREVMAREVTVHSPDGKNTLTVECPPAADARPVTFRVTRSGQTILDPSPIKITLAGRGQLAAGARLLDFEARGIDETFRLPWGKCREVRNSFCQVRLRFQSPGGVRWDLELRAYDDGIAFRYVLPEQESLREFVLESEATEYRFADDPTLLLMTVPNFAVSENIYRRTPLAEVPVKTLISPPLLAVWPGGGSAAVLEGRLRDFARMDLQRDSDAKPPVLRCRLSPLHGRKDACVTGRTPRASPWRTVLLADRAGTLLESNLLLCLNDPPQGDYSWAKPGKTTWHWWNGGGGKGLPFTYGMNYETHKHYIDFCARHGIAYHAVVGIDRPWYVQSRPGLLPGPDTDILKPVPELELPKLLDYAKQRGVGIRLWVHWQPLDKRLEEAFAQYEAWGIKGLMVDFLDRSDQEMVEFCDRVLESAARHKLHIQFHGVYPPSGQQRTFPNLFNHEAALNLEYLKWTDRCSPQHNLNVVYTRALAGPTDYHLGGFRSVSRAKFKPREDDPDVLGTRCHHLALYVVLENPLPQVCDKPAAYEGQTGFDFLEQVPTTWDETRFLLGEPGEYVVLARRKDRTWYLGGMTNWTARELNVPLSFLGPGKYQAELYVDGSLDEAQPNALRREEQAVTANAILKISLAPGGGFVGTIRPGK